MGFKKTGFLIPEPNAVLLGEEAKCNARLETKLADVNNVASKPKRKRKEKKKRIISGEKSAKLSNIPDCLLREHGFQRQCLCRSDQQNLHTSQRHSDQHTDNVVPYEAEGLNVIFIYLCR